MIERAEDRALDRVIQVRIVVDDDSCIAAQLESPFNLEFRRRLFSKIVPNVKSLGLLSDRQRVRFATLGILEFESNAPSDVDADLAEENRALAMAS